MSASIRESVLPLGVRDYRNLFFANMASFLGDQVVPVALAFAVLQVTGSASALGIVLLSRTVPMALFVLTGGVWADRLPRQLIMVGSDAVRFVSQGIFAALIFANHAPMWAMVVLQAVHGTATAFYRPASSGLLAQVLPRELRQRGVGLMYSMAGLTHVAGPAIAGVLLAVTSPAWALAIDAASFAVSAFLLTRVSPAERGPAKERQSFVRDLAEGWNEVISRSWLRSWILNFALFQFALLAVFWVLGPVVAKTSLGGGTAWAIMSASVGMGSLLGSLVAVRWHPKRPLVAVGGSLLLSPAVLLGLAAPAPVYALAGMSFLFGAVIAFADAIWESVMQNHVPERVLSRVIAYDYLGSTVLRPIGLAVVGSVAATITTQVTLVGASVLYLAVTLAALAMPITWTLSSHAPLQPEEAMASADLVETQPHVGPVSGTSHAAPALGERGR
ncbi:MFS transporter [Micromonospora aurantiaca (nom. illeg.)]|nr:MFS transporter [Micromonospora aurantiaca]ADL45382.1 major facilitator superfamily MFS_1 [Micromonospora aurantiaca ATCC 27029]